MQNISLRINEIDEGYFAGYSDPKIHEEMLHDKIRMAAYEKAI